MSLFAARLYFYSRLGDSPMALTLATQSQVTRRVSEAEWQYRFFLANASGYQKCATSKRVSEDFECIPRYSSGYHAKHASGKTFGA